jgi:hypothetical protein
MTRPSARRNRVSKPETGPCPTSSTKWARTAGSSYTFARPTSFISATDWSPRAFRTAGLASRTSPSGVVWRMPMSDRLMILRYLASEGSDALSDGTMRIASAALVEALARAVGQALTGRTL